MRVPAVTPLAPVAGWLTAWGAAAIAAASLRTAGVDLGLGLGIAEGAAVEDAFLPGLWMLIIQAGAFLIAGYATARMARAHGLVHAALAWAIAMLATGADALASVIRDGPTVLSRLDIPYWAETGLGAELDTVLALGAFALAALAGALIGGGMGQGANRAARARAERALSDGRVGHRPTSSPGEPAVARHDAERPDPARTEPGAVGDEPDGRLG